MGARVGLCSVEERKESSLCAQSEEEGLYLSGSLDEGVIWMERGGEREGGEEEEGRGNEKEMGREEDEVCFQGVGGGGEGGKRGEK